MSKLLLSTVVAFALATAGLTNFAYAAAKEDKSATSQKDHDAMKKSDKKKDSAMSKSESKKDTDDMKKSERGMEKGKDKGDEKRKAK